MKITREVRHLEGIQGKLRSKE